MSFETKIKLKENHYNIMFYEDQEVIIQHLVPENVTSVNLSKYIIDIEYSKTNGSIWNSPSYPIIFSGNTESVWRIKTYSGATTSGSIIINSYLT